MVSVGTRVSSLLTPKSAISAFSAVSPGWPGSEKSKVSRSERRPAATPPATKSTSQMATTILR